MKDTYLTKVERRTIFTYGLIYVALVIFISDITITGPCTIVTIPWLFLFGAIGINKLYHPVLTVSMAGVTSLFASLFKYGEFNVKVLTSTLLAIGIISAGICVGSCIRDFVFAHRLVKHMSYKKKISNILCICILTIVACTVHACRYGNIFSYINTKKCLNEYIASEAPNFEYSIVEAEYVAGSFDEYIYRVKVADREVILKVNDKVEIENFNARKADLEYELTNNILNITELSNLTKTSVKAEYEFDDITLLPNNIVVGITIKDLEKSDTKRVQDIVIAINKVLEYEDKYSRKVSSCLLSINKEVIVIRSKEDITKEKILNVI